MPSAEIITIGTEILLGDILDTNARFVARALRDAGIDLYRKTTVGDNIGRIAQAIQQAMERCDIVITTGGLGPTVDDPTREAVALAAGVELEYHPELWEQIQARFKRFGRQPTENNIRQAYIPAGAVPVENPVGTAPSFIVEHQNKTVISLPGVPREMEYLIEHMVLAYLKERYHLTGIIKSRVLHTSGAGESQIDDRIDDLERMSNPTVGLAAHSGQVDVRITVKASTVEEADALIEPIERELRQRLGEWVYGADQESLEKIALVSIKEHGWSLAVVEAGLGGELIRRMAGLADPAFRGGEVLPGIPSPKELQKLTNNYRIEREAEVGLGVAIHPAGERQDVYLSLVTPEGPQQIYRPYGGPAGYAPRWAMNHCLDILRKI